MFIALVHAIFHFIMHAWKGRKRAQLEKNEIFIYLKLIHTFSREIFATYVLLPNGLEENKIYFISTKKETVQIIMLQR